MKTVVVIPSRYGSSRFAGKPLALISGQPMIRRVYERARLAGCADDAVVATDDERIYAAVLDFGGRAVMTAPELRSGTDRAARTADLLNLGPDDIVINVQGDQPLLHPESLDDVTDPFFRVRDLQMSTLAYKIVNPDEITNPKDVKVVFDDNGYALYFSRSPIPCARDDNTAFDVYKHLGVYAYRRRFLDIFSKLPEGRLEAVEKLEQLRALEHGYQIMVRVTAHDSPEVDVPEDIARVEKALKREEEGRARRRLTANPVR